MRAGEILMALHNDVASVTDKLGYESYADAIARFLVDTDTPPPLSVSIQAPWGSWQVLTDAAHPRKLDPKEGREAAKIKFGASAVERLRLDGVLKFLNRATSVTFWQFIGGAKMGEPVETPAPTVKLANPDQRLTIWFNAWKYETSEQIWAGLVDAIVTQVSERLSLIERETFLLRLQLSRIDDGIVRKKIYDRVLTAWWATVQRWVADRRIGDPLFPGPRRTAYSGTGPTVRSGNGAVRPCRFRRHRCVRHSARSRRLSRTPIFHQRSQDEG